MIESVNITVKKVAQSRRSQTDFSHLPFGNFFTDHMFMADFAEGEWNNLRVVPYGKIEVSPATPAIHYGQSIFEGLKAHRGASGEALVFRPLDNLRRMNRSADRMCMPAIPEDVFMEGIKQLIALDRQWIPEADGSSLYVRPFLFSSDEYIGIRPSLEFTFMVILSPVGPYYSAPVRVKIETHFTRAARGGTGYAKAGGNYGGSIYPAKLAQDQGYHQLLWTDGQTHEYIEESGTMNVMFVIDGKIVTPELSDSILPGITRDSVIQLATEWNIPVEERAISVREVIDAINTGALTEAFGVGTAASISHIDTIGYNGQDYTLPPVSERAIANRLYDELEGIKRGAREDKRGWIVTM